MNKEFIEKTLICLIKSMYNEKIDFYIVGSIAGYIDAGIDIKRKHDDIDIMIKEKDIPKLKNIFKDSDYIFNDDRFCTNKYLNDKGYTEGEH